MTPRIFLDSCILVEGLWQPWSLSRGVLIAGHSKCILVLAEQVIEETERALLSKLAQPYGGQSRLWDDYHFLLKRWRIERVASASKEEVEEALPLIRHANDAPVLAAAMKARPDLLITENTSHFNAQVSARTGLRIVTPRKFLMEVGRFLAR